MKAITKKKFTDACCKEIKKMNNEDLEAVLKGLYILYNALKKNTNTIEFGNLNSSAAFLIDIAAISAEEVMERNRKGGVVI